MRKTVLLVLLAASASCFGQSAVPLFPRVVAQVHLTGQTMPIAPTALFTPKNAGLFRVSAYAAITTPAIGSAARWSVYIGWSDDAGAEGPEQLLFGGAGSVPPTASLICVSNLGCPLVVEDLAGVPLTYSVSNYLGIAGTYELFITVEQLM